jgi:hypothetical protein
LWSRKARRHHHRGELCHNPGNMQILPQTGGAARTLAHDPCLNTNTSQHKGITGAVESPASAGVPVLAERGVGDTSALWPPAGVKVLRMKNPTPSNTHVAHLQENATPSTSSRGRMWTQSSHRNSTAGCSSPSGFSSSAYACPWRPLDPTPHRAARVHLVPDRTPKGTSHGPAWALASCPSPSLPTA